MASFTRREVTIRNFARRAITIRNIDYLIPTGSPMAVWDEAATAALREWESLNPGKYAISSAWATVHTDDEHVIIRITIREVERRG